MTFEPTPKWASKVVDEYGNVQCKKCGNTMSPDYKACVYCCNHDELSFTEIWCEPGWYLDVECSICGKNYDFPNELIISQYKAVRK